MVPNKYPIYQYQGRWTSSFGRPLDDMMTISHSMDYMMPAVLPCAEEDVKPVYSLLTLEKEGPNMTVHHAHIMAVVCCDPWAGQANLNERLDKDHRGDFTLLCPMTYNLARMKDMHECNTKYYDAFLAGNPLTPVEYMPLYERESKKKRLSRVVQMHQMFLKRSVDLTPFVPDLNDLCIVNGPILLDVLRVPHHLKEIIVDVCVFMQVTYHLNTHNKKDFSLYAIILNQYEESYPEELTTASKKTGVPVINRMIQGNFVCVFVLLGWIRLVILHNSEVTVYPGELVIFPARLWVWVTAYEHARTISVVI